MKPTKQQSAKLVLPKKGKICVNVNLAGIVQLLNMVKIAHYFSIKETRGLSVDLSNRLKVSLVRERLLQPLIPRNLAQDGYFLIP